MKTFISTVNQLSSTTSQIVIATLFLAIYSRFQDNDNNIEILSSDDLDETSPIDEALLREISLH